MVSFLLQSQVLSGISLPSTAKAVYMQLLTRADEYKKCFPSVETLACDVGRSVRTVQRALKALCDLQLVQRQARYRLNSSQTSNLYTLLERRPEKLERKTPKQSYESKTALVQDLQVDKPGCFLFENIKIEALAVVPPGQKKSDACVASHTPQTAAQSSKPNCKLTVPLEQDICQAENMNKPKITKKMRLAVQFARLFAFSGIHFKEAMQMMEIAEIYGLMKHQALSNTAKLVFICMASAADAEGRCVTYPETLVKKLRKSKRTIQRALAALEGEGLIHMETEGAGSGPAFYFVFSQKCHPTG